MDGAHSLVRSTASRSKRNLSLLVGREEEDAQEWIFSGALSRIAMRKGAKFRRKQMEGGGVSGQGKEVTVGAAPEPDSIMPIEVFQEVKKYLCHSKKKMEEICQILRRNKVKLTPNVRSKLKDIDHLLDEEYITVRIKMKKTITVEVEKSAGLQKTGQRQKKNREKVSQCCEGPDSPKGSHKIHFSIS